MAAGPSSRQLLRGRSARRQFAHLAIRSSWVAEEEHPNDGHRSDRDYRASVTGTMRCHSPDMRRRLYRSLAQEAPVRPAPRKSGSGQALVEVALVLPVLLGLCGAIIDFSRFNEVRVKLEAATRDAAEYAATMSTSGSTATADARRVVCVQFARPVTCSDPAVTVTSYSSSTSAPGATAMFPLVTVVVSSSTSFSTMFPYPLLTNGGVVTLDASSSYAVLQGR